MTLLRIAIPEDLDPPAVQQLERAAAEFIAVQLYRQGKLSHGKLARHLGIGRGEVDALLARYGPFDEFTAEEIEQQVQTLRNLRDSEHR